MSSDSKKNIVDLLFYRDLLDLESEEDEDWSYSNFSDFSDYSRESQGKNIVSGVAKKALKTEAKDAITSYLGTQSAAYSATPLGGVAMAGEADIAGLAAAEAGAESAGVLSSLSAVAPYLAYAVAAYKILDAGFDWSGDSTGPPNLSAGQLLDAVEGRDVFYEAPDYGIERTLLPVINRTITDPGSGRTFDLTDDTWLNAIRSSYKGEALKANQSSVLSKLGLSKREAFDILGSPSLNISSGASKAEIDTAAKSAVDSFYGKVLDKESKDYSGTLRDKLVLTGSALH